VNDKQILITGATNGIGLAAAEALAAPTRLLPHPTEIP
jgi:NAD(P)-dependent dehydrogenase (short-subunit alcohol dehydrogenase family)